MIIKLLKFFLPLFLVEAIYGCSVKNFGLDKSYGCGGTNYDVFSASDLPSEFIGANTLTLGIWFKENLSLDVSYTDYFILYKITTTDQDLDRQPAVYIRRPVSESCDIVHHFLISSTNADVTCLTWIPQDGSWYFATEAVNIDGGNSWLMILDPSQMSISQLFPVNDQLTLSFTGFSYNSSHKIYFGAEPTRYTISCTSIWNPFMVVNYAPTSINTVLSLAFGIVPISTYNFGLQPYDVYENLFDDSDDSSMRSTQYDPGLFWSTNKQAYPSLSSYSTSEASLTALRWSHSFLNSNGSLSFSMRTQVQIQQYSNDSCSVYWIARRFSNQVMVFGFGVNAASNAVIQIQSTQNSILFSGFSFNTLKTVFFGCFGQWLSQTICIVYLSGSYDSPLYFVFANPTNYAESSNDILLLGAGNPPWISSDPPVQCGSALLLSVAMKQGAAPLPINNCYGGCLITTTGSNPKCYVQDTSTANVTCPTQSIFFSGNRDCTPCPLGCTTCALKDTSTYDVICISCSQNFVLNATSGICGCINSYYFRINPTTNQGECISKQNITVYVTNASQNTLVFNYSAAPNTFYTSLDQENVVLPFIKAYLQGVLLNSPPNYTITSGALTQLSITLILNASIIKDSILIVDFSAYNQIEGLPSMVDPSSVNYTFSAPYYYLDPRTQQVDSDIGKSTAIGSSIQLATTGSLAILSSGTSGAAVFLLDALGELEMYKYLNVNFPKNFVAFYTGLYSGSLIPNVYSYINTNGTIQISTYYKFADWQTPVLFIERLGDGFIKENIVFVLVILTWIPYFLCKKCKTKSKIIEKIHYTFRWNMLVSFLVADLTPFLVQIGLQFREAPFVTTDTFTIVSTSVSILVLISYVLIFSAGIYQINRRRLEIPDYLSNAKQKLQERIQKEKFPDTLTIFREEFNEDTAFDRNFLLIAKLEDVILSLNFICMQIAPLAQCYIYIFLTAFWLVVVLIGTPFKSKVGLAIVAFNELVKLILGIIAALLATNDSNNFLNPDMMLIVGQILIWTVASTIGVNTLVAIGCTLYSLYIICKKCCKRSKINREDQISLPRSSNESVMSLENASAT